VFLNWCVRKTRGSSDSIDVDERSMLQPRSIESDPIDCRSLCRENRSLVFYHAARGVFRQRNRKNPKSYAEAEGVLLGQFRHPHTVVCDNRGELIKYGIYIEIHYD
jgi:hypothetical protein